MTTLYDHATTPPTRYSTAGSCVLIPRLGSVPVANPPADIYPDAGRDASSITAGHRATGWERIVRDGKSVEVPIATEAIPLAEAKIAAITANQRECRRRILAAIHDDPEAATVIQITASDPLDATYTDGYKQWLRDLRYSHIAAENTARDAINAAETADVAVVWPAVTPYQEL